MSDVANILPLRAVGTTRAGTGSGITGNLAMRQHAFAKAILDPALPPPPGLVGPDGEPSARRFAVYRNNVVAGLIEALKHSYPAVLRLVGDEFFSAMTRVYVAGQPPKSPIMLDYGAGFAGFLATFPPVQSLPYLPDVVRLERAWLEAYHAAEALPLAADSLATIAATDFSRLRFTLHPSVRLVRSSFPALQIWQANIDSGSSVVIDIEAGGQDALVTRPSADVEVRELPVGAALFIEALALGAPVVEAAIAGLREAPQFDLAGTLAGLFEAGALVAWHLPDPASGDNSGIAS